MRNYGTNKLWYKSKTIWINLLTVVAGLTAVVELVPPEWSKFVLLAAGIANLVLRTITNEGIAFKE